MKKCLFFVLFICIQVSLLADSSIMPIEGKARGKIKIQDKNKRIRNVVFKNSKAISDRKIFDWLYVYSSDRKVCITIEPIELFIFNVYLENQNEKDSNKKLYSGNLDSSKLFNKYINIIKNKNEGIEYYKIYIKKGNESG